ncbi:armadillo-type protein [Zalerion maritima]|uniref:Armadillo-type protein n=1 Tax=Zalerion maritima TaxID=339359 RepID=A0AAD5WQ01_9PEZI|nr:armadillo-type protein [Zalerion maritima]
MDFLKSAVASAIAKGPAFPYSFGDQVDLDDSIWTLYNGTRREDGSNCSIFSFDVGAHRAQLPLARNAVKKLRTFRHPGVIKVLDTVESDSHIYIATERLVPLRWHVKRKSLTPETIKWGLYSIARTVKFVNDEASSIHGNLKVASVYTSESGEWKLGGFEVLSNVKDDDAIVYTYGSLVPDSSRYTPPELASSGWDAIKRSPHSAVDSYTFGTLIYEVFNGHFHGQDQAGQTKGVPPSIHAPYRRLVNRNPKARLSVGHFVEQGKRHGSFFDTPLIKLTEGIDNLGLKSEAEREEFLDNLESLSDDFPEDFFKMKILPELLKSVEFGGGGPKAFSVVMKIGAKLSNEDFDTKVTPVVVRLFSNPDRAIRVCLLDNLPHMIDRLSQKIVNDKIFPPLVTGFTDIAPLVREQTLKSTLTIITKLSDRTINGELLKYLAKTANDEQPGIRTNTTICLGKIAKHLGTSNRSKVLVAAFTRSLRDPFVHARNAALMALAATAEFLSDEECACRVMPVVCPLLIDKEKMARDQASITLEVFMKRTRKAAEGMPDTVFKEPVTGGSHTPTPRMGTPQTSGSGAVPGAWAGWAISSFTNKLSSAAGEMQTGHNGAPTASPSPTPERKPSPLQLKSGTSSASVLHRQAVKSPGPTPLSRTASSGSAAAAAFLPPEPEPEASFDDAWGSMGDMDDDDAFGDAWGAEPSAGKSTPPSSSSPPAAKKSPMAAKKATPSSAMAATPFLGSNDDGEPDFAGWLAAQAEKKKGGVGAKPLPKGLSKGGAKKGITGAAAKKPMAAPKKKTVDLKPKDDVGDDDGWGEGW